MRKSVADALNISRRRIALSVDQPTSVLCNKDALWTWKKKKIRCDAICDEHKQIAQEFWGSPGISRATGNKNDVKRERIVPKEYLFHEKQVLEKTQTEVFEEFKMKYHNIKMGQRAFKKCKPFYVIEARPQDRQSCCCRAHVEMRMVFKSCMNFRRDVLKRKPENERETYPVYEHLSEVVNETMCNNGNATNHRLSCINRDCKDCGVTNLNCMLEEEDTSLSATDVKWEKFEYVPIGDDKGRLL